MASDPLHRVRDGDLSGALTGPNNPSALGCLLGLLGVVLSLVSAPNLTGILGAALAVIVVTIAVIDWRRFIIPDALNFIGFGLALAHAAVRDPSAITSSVMVATLRGVLLALIFLLLRITYARIRHHQGLGLGDVKLAAVAGAWLDWPTLPIALQLAVLAALVSYLIRQLALRQSISAKTPLPFGFFFAPMIWICWLLEIRGLAIF